VSQLAVMARHSHALRAPLLTRWSVEETDACFTVRDHNGRALTYVYCEDEARKSQR
jgi:hypothetical protein